MTDELLTKLDAFDASSLRGPRRRARRCCDVVVRVVVLVHVLALVMLVGWGLHLVLLETPRLVTQLARVDDGIYTY